MDKYVLYVGLNDKDSRTQKITVPEAFTVASNICANLAGGGTIHTGRGVYTHDDGGLVVEETLIIELFGASGDVARAVSDACKVAFNQESIGAELVISNVDFW